MKHKGKHEPRVTNLSKNFMPVFVTIVSFYRVEIVEKPG